ncbi:hypothetical protein OAK38_06050 [Verrucomicrobia bacterium]|nr:hypothetical protein [Verrucomicrobiota bacterium]
MDPREQFGVLFAEIMVALADSALSLDEAESVLGDAHEILEDNDQSQLAGDFNFHILKRLRRIQHKLLELESAILDDEPQGPWQLPFPPNDISRN